MLVRQVVSEKPGREVSTYPAGVKIAWDTPATENFWRGAVTGRYSLWQSALRGILRCAAEHSRGRGFNHRLLALKSVHPVTIYF
ncbi:hypothetical protein PUATCC27989T_00792 [Phytobacter ursingii]|nr:hypothetical protein PUATCC27989T_00792 [Phytobacter ursingii]